MFNKKFDAFSLPCLATPRAVRLIKNTIFTYYENKNESEAENEAENETRVTE